MPLLWAREAQDSESLRGLSSTVKTFQPCFEQFVCSFRAALRVGVGCIRNIQILSGCNILRLFNIRVKEDVPFRSFVVLLGLVQTESTTVWTHDVHIYSTRILHMELIIFCYRAEMSYVLSHFIIKQYAQKWQLLVPPRNANFVSRSARRVGWSSRCRTLYAHKKNRNVRTYVDICMYSSIYSLFHKQTRWLVSQQQVFTY